MSAIDRLLRAADRFQQRRPALAFPVAVWTKFNQDKAGNLAALISYYAFAALFPLLLVLVTVLNIVLKSNPSLRADLLNSALAQYPVIGQQIEASLGEIPGTGLPLVIGAVLLVLGARGVAGAMQNAMYEVWDIKQEDRPGFPRSPLWGIALVLTIGIGFIVTTFLSGLAGGAGHILSGAGAYIGAVLISLVLNFGVFWLGFRIATARLVPWRHLRVGAAIAAVCWQILQVVGGYVVSHQLRRASELYGTFGIVLGLMAWLFLQAEITLYAAETDVVLARRLWPRSIVPAKPGQPPQASPAGQVGPAGQAGQPGQAGHAGQSGQAGQASQPPQSGQAGQASPAGQAGQPDPESPAGSGPAEVPPPRGHAEYGRHAYQREAAGWISRARRAVTRR